MNLANSKRRFEEDGFLRVENLFSGGKLLELERELKLYNESVVPTLPPGDIVYETDSTTGERTGVRNLWRMEKYSSYFDEFAHQPQIIDLVRTLVNGEPVLMAVELFAKPARVGSAVPYHQDNGYFNLTPPDALTFWLALDDSTVENGCVYYARGSHRQGVLPHKASLVPGNSWGLAERPDPSQLDEVPGIIGARQFHSPSLLPASPKRKEPERPAAPRAADGFQRCALHCEHSRYGSIPGSGEGTAGTRRRSESHCLRLGLFYCHSRASGNPACLYDSGFPLARE